MQLEKRMGQIQNYLDQQVQQLVKTWVRVLQRADCQIHLSYNGELTTDDIESIKIKDIAFSDSEDTIYTNQSWYIENVSFITSTNLPINQVIANVFNGKTPSGTEQSQDYDGGYLHYSGIIQTYGDFSSFYMGANYTAHIKIGTSLSLRTGGGKHHTGEFIHSSCNGNGYSEKNILLLFQSNGKIKESSGLDELFSTIKEAFCCLFNIPFLIKKYIEQQVLESL